MSRKPVQIKPECGDRLKSALKDSGITQKELAVAIHLSQQTISEIVTRKASLTEQNAKLIAAYLNEQRGITGCDDNAIRWQFLFGLDDHKTIASMNRALMRTLDSPDVKRADQLQWACDVLLQHAMHKLNLSDGNWKLEDMASGDAVPFTEAQQDKLCLRLQEYAEGLIAHHLMQAKINQVELACAESRNDSCAISEIKKKLEEEI